MGNEVCRNNDVLDKEKIAELAAQTQRSKEIDKELSLPPPRLLQKLILLGG